jgi:type I restriction enzyme S subunit
LPVTEAQRARHRLKHEDVLVLEGGDADKVGRGWLWESQLTECLHQNHVFAVRPDAARLLPRFLAHYINAPQARAYFLASAKQTTNLASINKRQLRELPVPLMSLAAQEALVELLDAQLSATDATTSSLATQARHADQLKAALLHQALTGGLSGCSSEVSANKHRAVLVGEYS